jgi:hypothetical protein
MKQLIQNPKTDYDDLLVEIVNVIQSARRAAARSVNSVMTEILSAQAPPFSHGVSAVRTV